MKNFYIRTAKDGRLKKLFIHGCIVIYPEGSTTYDDKDLIDVMNNLFVQATEDEIQRLYEWIRENIKKPDLTTDSDDDVLFFYEWGTLNDSYISQMGIW